MSKKWVNRAAAGALVAMGVAGSSVALANDRCIDGCTSVGQVMAGQQQTQSSQTTHPDGAVESTSSSGPAYSPEKVETFVEGCIGGCVSAVPSTNQDR